MMLNPRTKERIVAIAWIVAQLGVLAGILAGVAHWVADPMIIVGVCILAAWAAAVLWGLGQTALSARKGQEWEQAYLVGLVVGCALGAGMMPAIKNSLPFDTFGMGFVLAVGGGLAIWAFGHTSRKDRS